MRTQISNTEESPLYFPGLNGIRAIAALLVVCSHISMSISDLGFLGFGSIAMAGYGVTMFFVLSGYLITYLLLTEYKKNGEISYKKFYIRRILRIWPIYYLSLLIALVWMYSSNQSIDIKGLLFYIFMMANVPFIYGGTVGLVAHLWSVGVEEQFYLFWPWLFKVRDRIFTSMIVIILFYMILRIIFRIIENGPIYTLIGTARFHCMAIGGLGALAVFEKWSCLKHIYNPVLQAFCWLILIFSVYSPFHTFSIIDGELYALIFIIIIINVSTNKKSLVKLENRVMHWLGRISYGIYVYHMFAIGIIFYLVKNRIQANYPNLAILYLSVIGLTLLFADLSFRYFEATFMKIKNKFSIIQSSNFKVQ